MEPMALVSRSACRWYLYDVGGNLHGGRGVAPSDAPRIRYRYGSQRWCRWQALIWSECEDTLPIIVGQRVHLQGQSETFHPVFNTLAHFTYLILDILGSPEEM